MRNQPILIDVFRKYPVQSIILWVGLLLAGLADGVSIAMFLPILETFSSSGSPSAMSQWLFRLLEFFHLKPTLTSMVIFTSTGMALRGVFLWFTMRRVGFMVSHIATLLRLDLMRAVLGAKWSYFVTQRTGHLASGIGIEAKIAAKAFESAAVVAAQGMEVAVYVVVCLFLSWQATVLATTAAMILAALSYRFITMSRRAGHAHIASARSLSASLTDAIHGVKAVKAMAREHLFMRLLARQAEKLNIALRQRVTANQTITALQEPLTFIFLAVGLLAGTRFTSTPFPMLIMMGALFMRMLAKFNAMMRNYASLVNEESAYFSINNAIESAQTARESVADANLPPPPQLLDGIFLDSVSFSYGGSNVLDNVSVRIPSGKFVAVVGESGSGKTTIADLITGLQVPKSGRVLIDGVALSDCDLRQWRDRIGYVPQEIFLFHDTLRNNITLGDTDITGPTIERALRDADATAFVSEMPEGLDTVVGERGARLSGGQRQRIALARALVRNPRLLVLDEITASLDPDSEAEICRVLQALRGRTTVLAISHQPVFTRMADVVLRVGDGKVVLAPPNEPTAGASEQPLKVAP